MPTKSLSPEEAQKRVWKAEIATLKKNRRKVELDIKKARRVALAEFLAAERKFKKTDARLVKVLPRTTNPIARRIAILEGRIGI